MNERIRELELQADEWAVANYTWTPTGNNWGEVYMEKFALLIVQECIAQVDKSNYNSGDEWDKAMTCAANNIKEHFGVEE